MSPQLAGPLLTAAIGIALVAIAAIVGRVVLRAGQDAARVAQAEAAAAAALVRAQRAEDIANEAREYAAKRADAVAAQYVVREKKARSRRREPEEQEPEEQEPATIERQQQDELKDWAKRMQGGANGV